MQSGNNRKKYKAIEDEAQKYRLKKKKKSRIYLICVTDYHSYALLENATWTNCFNFTNGETVADNGNKTVVTPQSSGRAEISDFFSLNLLMHPLGSTALVLYQNHYKLLNQDYGNLYHLCTD